MCLYESHIRRRGLPEGYVRGMELLASLAIRHVDNFEELLLSRLLRENKEQRFVWHSHFDELLDVWKKSKLSTELERLLPYLPSPKSLALKRKFEENQDEESLRRHSARLLTSTPRRTTSIDDHLSIDDGSFQGHLDIPQLNELLEGDGVPDQLLRETNTALRPGQLSNSISKGIQLPAQWSSFLKFYFFQTHCWLPIVDKPEVMRSSYQFINKNPITEPKCGSLALLWAIVALSSSRLLKLGTSTELLGTETVSEDLVLSYYSKARGLIPCEEELFDLDHVQALLLLSLIKIDQSSWSAARILIGKAAQIAMDLKPMLQTSGSDPQIMARYGRTYLGCFVLDTLVSSHLAQLPHLQQPDSFQICEIEEHGLDEWDIWSNPFDTAPVLHDRCLPLFTFSTFNRLVSICKIIHMTLLASIYGPKFSANESLADLEKKNSKHPWVTMFKDPGRENSPETKMLPHHYHLRIFYLIAVSEVDLRLNTTTAIPSYQAAKGSVCAAEAVALMHRFKDEFGLHTAPQTWSLIRAILSKSQSIVANDLNRISPRPLTYNACLRSNQAEEEQALSFVQQPSREADKRDRMLQSRPGGYNPAGGSTAHFDADSRQHEPSTDSDYLFEELLAIDTSDW
ncbi:uncharacterized protein N7511_005032 [Penicillium nucicola]|uniref:uncharacterized protein n=1 Tax=Penicillium nucicola TaxID=1850975 RepID=UPI002545B87B|nr:uncharacterized protein N7511_005032 [Penicillium nucicola]KAJ5767416.1 hypothetical protein N7511_005032 [Penicillium nucicola]